MDVLKAINQRKMIINGRPATPVFLLVLQRKLD
jgi:hypothetical protein